MTVPLRYAYLVSVLPFLAFWLLLYARRKDLRKQMRFMSLFVALSGLIAEGLWWTVDWWHPPTITGTRVGIEDFLLGYTNGGIAAVLYETVFKKRLAKGRVSKGHLAAMVMVTFSAMAISFWALHLTSFVSTVVALLAGGGAVLWFRKDLLPDALWSGLLMMALSVPVYWFMLWLAPDMVDLVWDNAHLTGLRPVGIPIEDLVFYFLTGFAAGPFYEYLRGEKLKDV